MGIVRHGDRCVSSSYGSISGPRQCFRFMVPWTMCDQSMARRSDYPRFECQYLYIQVSWK